MTKLLNPSRLDWIAFLACQNAVRLHRDAIALYKEGRYPSAFFLSILSQEELGKMHMINDHSWHLGEWLNDLLEIKDQAKRAAMDKENEKYQSEVFSSSYLHPLKQGYFAHNSPVEDFVWLRKALKHGEPRQDVWQGVLDAKKQTAAYVGFPKKKRGVDFSAGLKHPWQIKKRDAQRQITRVNDYLLVFGLGLRYTCYVFENEDIINYLKNKRFLKNIGLTWQHRSRSAFKQIESLQVVLKDKIVRTTKR